MLVFILQEKRSIVNTASRSGPQSQTVGAPQLSLCSSTHTTALLTSLSRTDRGEEDEHSESEEKVHRLALRLQLHVVSPRLRQMKSRGGRGVVVPAGTRAHKEPSVLPRQWESTTVAVCVTSSRGLVLNKAPGDRNRDSLLPREYLHLFELLVLHRWPCCILGAEYICPRSDCS